MIFQQFTRYIHTTLVVFASAEKSALVALRKKTGYTFSNCKKALEMYNNDLNLAEKWLHGQAQSLGWSKATKLAERATAQGQVGVLVRGNIGAMVEVNCETDFVARNEQFKNFVDHVSNACAKYTELAQFDGDLWKSSFEAESLKSLKSSDGKTLADHLALLIGTMGENVTIRRAICFKVNNDCKLFSYVHPQAATHVSLQNITKIGKYGTLVAFSGNKIDEQIQKNICQHIVGMNPKKVGEFGKDTPNPNKDDETCLVHQEYLIDEEKTVGEFLEENNLLIIDYQRYECGETSPNE